MRLLPILIFATLFASGCPQQPPDPEPPAPELPRCELDIDARADLFPPAGNGARALRIERTDQAIGGQFAAGRPGDFLLRNDLVRAVISQPGREIIHSPFGGALVDADLVRADGEPGRDQLGKLAMFHAFGRGIDAQRVEVLRDGSNGGPAVIAATGYDALNDYITLEETIDKQGLGLELVVDPSAPLPLRATTYFSLAPGQRTVRMVTAFCNDGDQAVSFPVGEISVGGGTMDFFNPEQCRGTLGEADCLVDPSSWFGWQGDGVAYGFRTFQLDDPSVVDQNALIYLSGSAAIIAGARDLQGVLTWVDPTATQRPGTLGIRAGEQALYVRELAVTRHLGEVRSLFAPADGAARVTVTSAGAPVPNARIAVERAGTGELVAPLVADGEGRAEVQLPPGSYQVVAGLPGHGISAEVPLSAAADETTPAAVVLGEARRLTVTVADVEGEPLPAKVVLRCPGGPCPNPARQLLRVMELETPPDEVALVGYVPPQGAATFQVPPGDYEVFVSRGPEYNLWPDTAPGLGWPVSLMTADGSVDAVLGRVVDTSGWLSGDLHVHAVNSADASPANEDRVRAFAAEGVEVLVATDHDFITDYAPIIEALGAGAFVRSIIGEEISPSWAHHNAFPLTRDRTFNGGALDWAGGGGATLRPGQIYDQVKTRWPGAVVQVNHARGTQGLFQNMKLDTLTGATHADPSLFRMASPAGATVDDTGLFSTGFDALEVQNGPNPSYAGLNDWMTFLSRGIVRAATSVSDTHKAFQAPSGYGRTWVRTVDDRPSALDPAAFAEGVRAMHAVGSNGPFLTVSAQAVDAQGSPVRDAVGPGETLAVRPDLGEQVRFTVRVQAPEWMQFDRVELYTHAEGREAWNGEANGAWPASRIFAQRQLDPLALPVIPVPGVQGLRRVEVVETFDVPVSRDGWFVAMVRATQAVRDLFPLYFRPACAEDGSGCAVGSARPFGFANPVFVDADGTGAYDDFPL